MTPSTAQQVETLTRAIAAVKACGLRAVNGTLGPHLVIEVWDGEEHLGDLAFEGERLYPLSVVSTMYRGLRKTLESLRAVCAAYEEGR